MYQLLSAIAKPLTGSRRWAEVAIGNIALNVLFSTYSRVLVKLSNPFLPNPVTLDLESIRSSNGGQVITFNQFLINNGAAALPTTTTIPTINTRYAKYNDAFRAGYKIAPIHPTAAPDAVMPLKEKRWLHMTRPNTDYQLFFKSCLVSVNGFFHTIDAGPQGIYVKEGMQSAFLSRENQIGILSFRELGEITTIPIEAENVFKQIASVPYSERAYIDLGMDVSDKTIMLVLGGYLHLLDSKTFYRVNDSCVGIDMANLPLLGRYHESKKYLDYTSLALHKTSRNDSQVGVNDFFADDTMLAYLTLPQSFIVILDKGEIFTERHALQKTRLPDVFISHQKPNHALVVGLGRIVNYWAALEDRQWSITCRDTLSHNPVYGTVPFKLENSLGNSDDPENPTSHSNAFFLHIGTDLA